MIRYTKDACLICGEAIELPAQVLYIVEAFAKKPHGTSLAQALVEARATRNRGIVHRECFRATKETSA